VDFVRVAQFVIFVASLATTITGAIFIVDIITDNPCCDEVLDECLGPLLILPQVVFGEDVNLCYRTFFSLDPNIFLVIFTPLVLGLMSLYVHFSKDIYWIFLYRTWFRTSMWLLFVALFGNFGYAGNIGIISGFLMSFASFLCVVVHFSGRVGTGPFFSTSFRINNQELFPGPGVGGLVTFLSIVSALFTFILGCIHIFRSLPDVCLEDENVDPPIKCVGPALFWLSGNITENVNLLTPLSWGSTLFSLSPSQFIPNFTPLFFGVIGLAATLSSDNYFPWLFASYSRIMWWHLVVSVFANFGYIGKFGIMTGFISAIVAFLALLMVLCGYGGTYYGASSFGRGIDFGYILQAGRGLGGTYEAESSYRERTTHQKRNYQNTYDDQEAPPPNNRSNFSSWFSRPGTKAANDNVVDSASNSTFARSPASSNSNSASNNYGRSRNETDYTIAVERDPNLAPKSGGKFYESDGRALAGAGKREVEALFGKQGNRNSGYSNNNNENLPGATKTVDRGPNSKYGIAGRSW